MDPGLTLPALTLALASAALHAVWNLLVARARDVEAATAATFVLSVAIAAPFAVIWWSAEPSVWPYALASTLLETLYVIALAYAYRTTDLSFVYPLTRGLAPVIVLVAAGVLLVRGPEGSGGARAILVVLTIATTIAAYTLVDRVGIQHAGALTYFVLVLAGPCLVYPPLVGAPAIRSELRAPTWAAAVANVGSFSLGLLALRTGPAAPVLAVRSSSIVIATLLAGRLLAERVAPLRLAGSALVFVGVALLAV